MKITGLDLSFTRTGVAHIHLERQPLCLVCNLKAHARLGTGHERLQWLMEELSSHTKNADLVAIEGPAFNRDQGQHALGGLWWMTAHGLWKRKIPYVVITPTQLKKYATGKGNRVSKDEVMAAAIRRYPDVPISCNDEADAFILAAMCADYLGQPVAGVPQVNREALATIDWPPLPFAA